MKETCLVSSSHVQESTSSKGSQEVITFETEMKMAKNLKVKVKLDY